jgi:hypothetical protein
MKKILAILIALLMTVSVADAVIYETPAGTHLVPTKGGSESSGTRVTGSLLLDENNKVHNYRIFCTPSETPICFRLLDGGKKLDLPDGPPPPSNPETSENEGELEDDVTGL